MNAPLPPPSERTKGKPPQDAPTSHPSIQIWLTFKGQRAEATLVKGGTIVPLSPIENAFPQWFELFAFLVSR